MGFHLLSCMRQFWCMWHTVHSDFVCVMEFLFLTPFFTPLQIETKPYETLWNWLFLFRVSLFIDCWLLKYIFLFATDYIRCCWRRCCHCCCHRRCRRCVNFHDGITRERFELSSWFFAWWFVMTMCFESEFGSQFNPCRPARPAKSLFLAKKFTMG